MYIFEKLLHSNHFHIDLKILYVLRDFSDRAQD